MARLRRNDVAVVGVRAQRLPTAFQHQNQAERDRRHSQRHEVNDWTRDPGWYSQGLPHTQVEEQRATVTSALRGSGALPR